MSTVSESDLLQRVAQWIDDDVDPETQGELRALVARGAAAMPDLADRFAGSLEFGTAGLRGVIGAGPNRMNRAVVLRTTHGLATYLLSAAPGARERGVVIGYDGRRLSRELAEDTACVLASHGIRAHLWGTVVPTPVTAFAVSRLGAAAGVMVTASHNPPEYNGYKVYWGNGAQIIPPIDAGIAAAIAQAPAARAVPRMPLDRARVEGRVLDVAPAVTDDYLARVRALTVHPGGDRAFPIVYTPMHGVGGAIARRAFQEAGFTRVDVVREQAEPDARFPTVAFPNPEEKGAMDLSFALARTTGAALVLANDPDADRLAVAVPLASSPSGGDRAARSADAPSGYLQLTGNQVGVLLGHYLLTEGKDQAPGRLVIASLVSSPLLGVIARELGVAYEETLTGFKWIANKAMEREAQGERFVFGYEEALGYTVGDVVRDKDGISAAVVMAEMVAWLRGRGETLLDHLEAVHRRFGLFVSSQVNITRKGASGASEIRAIMDRLRAAKPRAFGAHEVAVVRDYDASTALRVKEGRVEPIAMPKSNVLAFELAGGSRIIARPSGTEPKIKFYFDVREPMREAEPLGEAEARASETMGSLQRAFEAIAMGSEGEGSPT